MNIVITNKGLQDTAKLVAGGDIAPFKYIAIGDGSGDISNNDNSLFNEIKREEATVSYNGNTLILTHTFFISGSATIREAGIFNSATNGNMYLHSSFGDITLENEDFQVEIDIEYE